MYVMHEIDSGVVQDRSDDRDHPYIATSSAPLPSAIELVDYRTLAEDTWHQRGEECTGFALAAIANFLIRRIDGQAEQPSVSRRMLYEMAQRYDGAMHVEGSTLRGALKGWSRVGVASDDLWPYHPNDEHGAVHGTLTLGRVLDGRTRPLMAYQRITDERVDLMKRALVEGNPLYVATRTHVGWYRLFLNTSSAAIERRPTDVARGIHAFVIIGYTEDGFVIHNSWGPEWGDDGYAVLPYDQWIAGATDGWVVDGGIASAREPVVHDDLIAALGAEQDQTQTEQTYRDMWPHLVVLRDDGQLASTGLYEMDEGSVKTLLYLFDEYTRSEHWTQPRLAVIADGAGQGAGATIDHLRPLRDKMLANEIYPIFIVWETGWHDDLAHELLRWTQHRSGDDMPTSVATKISAAESLCQAVWDAIQNRAALACAASAGAQLLAESIAYKRGQQPFDLHLVSHGAGDLLLAPLATLLPTPITSSVAVASALTLAEFRRTYGEMLVDGCLRHQTIATLNPDAEAADRFGSTDASLLELASQVWELSRTTIRHAAQAARRTKTWDIQPVPVVGLQTHAAADRVIGRFHTGGHVSLMAIAGLSHTELLFSDDVQNRIVAELLTEWTTLPGQLSGLDVVPRDPLLRANLLLREQR